MLTAISNLFSAGSQADIKQPAPTPRPQIAPPLPPPQAASSQPAPILVQALWPPPSNRMPHPEAGLVSGIAQLFDTNDAAEAERQVRQVLPDILQQFFPWSAPEPLEAPGISFYLADCVLLYALQTCKSQLPNPHLRAFVDDFCAAVSVARKIMRLVEGGEDPGAIVEHGIQRFLRQGRTVMCPGGSNLGSDGHAIALLFVPQPDGDTLCAVFNRGEGLEPWHERDGEKVRPWLALLPSEALCAEPAAAALRTLLEIQQPHQDHTVESWYQALGTLVDTCNGTRILSGSPRAGALMVYGQSLQKSNECTVSGTLAAMNFLMHVQLRCWQDPPTNTHENAQAAYREIKQACRKVLLQEVAAERAAALQRGDIVTGRALTQALCDVATGMQQRLQRKPALRECYHALPSDIQLLTKSTDASAATETEAA